MKKHYEDLLVSGETSIKEAMHKLNETAGKVLYIVDEEDNLYGAISDGDIRRGLLKGITLESSIVEVMNVHPKYIAQEEKMEINKIKEVMLKFKIESLPVLNQNKKIVDVIYWVDVFKNTEGMIYPRKSNQVFILAGGFGTRLEPFTKILPKPLIPIGDEPILEKIMNKFLHYGFNEFILSVNYKADMIRMYLNDCRFKNEYSKIEYVQEEKPLGTIGSLYLAKDQIKDTFFISNSDILIEENLDEIFKFHKENQAMLTIVGCIKNSIIPYGVLNTNDEGNLLSIDEKPAYKHVINTGVYVAEPEVISYIKEGKKQDITEIISELLTCGQKISIYPILENQWFDIGQWEEFEKTKKHFEA